MQPLKLACWSILWPCLASSAAFAMLDGTNLQPEHAPFVISQMLREQEAAIQKQKRPSARAEEEKKRVIQERVQGFHYAKQAGMVGPGATFPSAAAAAASSPDVEASNTIGMWLLGALAAALVAAAWFAYKSKEQFQNRNVRRVAKPAPSEQGVKNIVDTLDKRVNKQV